MASDIEHATALEADALIYPDERGAILLEAAVAWIRAGESERGTRLLEGLVGGGGEDGCYARTQLVEVLLGADRRADADLQLEALKRDPALHDGHCQLVAELLAGRSVLDGALEWYDLLLARIPPEELDAVRGADGWAQPAAVPVRGRRAVRRRMGLPPDSIDAIVPVAPLEKPQDLDDLRTHLSAGRPPPMQLRVLTFQRAARAEARRTWPDLYTDSDEDYYPVAEHRWREMAERGVPAIRVVPATVAGLVAFGNRVGGDPTESEVRARYAETVPLEQTIAWPPPRNSRCWCGTTVKYKKCCGRAQ